MKKTFDFLFGSWWGRLLMGFAFLLTGTGIASLGIYIRSNLLEEVGNVLIGVGIIGILLIGFYLIIRTWIVDPIRRYRARKKDGSSPMNGSA